MRDDDVTGLMRVLLLMMILGVIRPLLTVMMELGTS